MTVSAGGSLRIINEFLDAIRPALANALVCSRKGGACNAATGDNMHIRTAIAAVLLTVAGWPLAAFACDAHRPEEFSSFFSHFSTDRDFAFNRTIYPSARVRLEYGIEGGKQQIIERRRTVTRQGDAASPALGDYIKSNQLEFTVVSIESGKTVVDIFKPDLDWVLSYQFVSKNGCWFLREIQYHAL